MPLPRSHQNPQTVTGDQVTDDVAQEAGNETDDRAKDHAEEHRDDHGGAERNVPGRRQLDPVGGQAQDGVQRCADGRIDHFTRPELP